MKNSKEMLSSLLKTTQLGQTGIRSVLDQSMAAGLRCTLCNQLQEYNSIEAEAHAIASQRGWELRDLEPAVRFLTDRTTRFRLTGENSDSRIADIMIRYSTSGMIQGLRNLHQFSMPDQRIRMLSQRLLDCENAGILKLQSYL